MKFFFMIVVPLICCAKPSWAEADGPDHWKVTGVQAGDSLNLREQPSQTGKILFKIPYNARNLVNKGICADKDGKPIANTDVKVKSKPFWCKISYNEKIGWAASRFLIEDLE